MTTSHNEQHCSEREANNTDAQFRNVCRIVDLPPTPRFLSIQFAQPSLEVFVASLPVCQPDHFWFVYVTEGGTYSLAKAFKIINAFFLPDFIYFFTTTTNLFNINHILTALQAMNSVYGQICLLSRYFHLPRDEYKVYGYGIPNSRIPRRHEYRQFIKMKKSTIHNNNDDNSEPR